MNTFIVQFNNGKEEKIEADRYVIEDGFLTFQTYGINVLSLNHETIDIIKFHKDHVNKKNLKGIRGKFMEKYE